MNIANSKCERTKPRTTPEKCGWYIRLLNVFKFALLFSPHPLNLHHVSEFYMGMSKNFEYLSVSKGHLKASLGSTQNSTFVARVKKPISGRSSLPLTWHQLRIGVKYYTCGIIMCHSRAPEQSCLSPSSSVFAGHAYRSPYEERVLERETRLLWSAGVIMCFGSISYRIKK